MPTNSHTEPIDVIESEDYRLSLLTRFRSKSKYTKDWQALKTNRVLNLSYNPALIKHHKVIANAVSRLQRQDIYYKEYCRLTYGKELNFTSFHCEETLTVSFKLLDDNQYANEISRLRKETASKLRISNFE